MTTPVIPTAPRVAAVATVPTVPTTPLADRKPRILLVDDEQRVLDALSRTLRRGYDVVVATSGATGLLLIRDKGPFAVIVSDMWMPGMDGAEFLAGSRVRNPDAVRILLTGQADIESAMNAVNDGQIFRFLQKPCSAERLETTLEDAVKQYRLITGQRELLEKTLRGSVEVLTEVLALVSPVAFARSLRLKRLAIELADALKIDDTWAIELSAMFSDLGAITVPPDVLQRHYRGDPLEPDEREMIAHTPDVTKQLIGHLPRLELVREILRMQRAPFDGAELTEGFLRGEAIPIGARLLLIAKDFDTLESHGDAPGDSLTTMEARAGLYDPRALQALRALKCGKATASVIREMPLIDVQAGMIFARDVVGSNGMVLIGRGQEATPSLVRRIRNFWGDFPLTELPQVIISSGRGTT